jgi:FkbM family methyltransferase
LLARLRKKLGLGSALWRLNSWRAGFGVLSALRLVRLRGLELKVRPRWAAFPLIVRTQTSDVEVLRQIFVRREYASLDELNEVRLVIDCGANVGYSSTYFLSRFPNSTLVAVEPDQSNFDVLKRNLAPYGHRATAIRAGVWSSRRGLKLSDETYRDGREWTRQVRESGPGESADVDGIDIASLLLMTGFERISLLKMDIEGAEAVVFGANVDPWLDRVDNIVIELHDDSSFGRASDVFHRAIAGRGFATSQSEELTICRRQAAYSG